MSVWLALALAAHRRRRARDPLPAAPRRDRRRLLAHVRGRGRGPRRDGPRDDGGVAPRADLRLGPLVAARHLARDPRLPLLHDHRPADDPRERSGRRAYAVSVGLLATLLIAPWTTEFAAKLAVLGLAHDRLRRAAAASAPRGPGRLGRAIGWTPAPPRRRGWRSAAGVLSSPRACSRRPPPRRVPRIAVGARSRGDRRRDARARPDRRCHGAADRRRARRRPPERVRRRSAARDRAAREARRRRATGWPSSGAASTGRRAARSTSRATRRSSVRLRLEPGKGQGPPLVVATLSGTSQTARYAPEDGSVHVPERPAGRRPHVRARPERQPVPRHGRAGPHRRAPHRRRRRGAVHPDGRRERASGSTSARARSASG